MNDDINKFLIGVPSEPNIVFYVASNEVMRIDKRGITVNPAYSVDEATQRVLDALSGHIQHMVAQAVAAERDALLEALKGITPSMPPADAPCHYGIVPQEKCGHCGRIAKARAAIKAVEEGK